MRYEDWDIILFPVGRDSKIPFKEFKVACHAVPDLELAHIHGSVGMPAMTCFVPSLPAGTPFQISIHSWKAPDISQYTRAYSKHTDLVKFEARILLDGRMVASTAFDRRVHGPHLITSTFEFTKTGELERLRFPQFRRELMYQNHWSPSDDMGRIKVIISEGFPRDSLSVPIERVKNVVVFSFQHAPLEILESNGIAWPSPLMWRRPPFSSTMPVPTYQSEDGANSHTHSPRRKSEFPQKGNQIQGFQGPFQTQPTNAFLGAQSFPVPWFQQNNAATNSSLSCPDPFSEAAYLEWINSMTAGQSSSNGFNGAMDKTIWPDTRNSSTQSSDTSMPDYLSNCSIGEPMHISGPSLEDNPMSLKVPTNTPTAVSGDDFQSTSLSWYPGSVGQLLPTDLATSLTHSLLNQPLLLPIQPQAIPLPASEIKSRKENRHLAVPDSNLSSSQSTPQAAHMETRKFSHPVFNLGGGGNLGGNLHMMNRPLSTSSSTTNTTENSNSTSPSMQPSFSANNSRDESERFGANIANLNTGCSPVRHASLQLLGQASGDCLESSSMNADGVNCLGGGGMGGGSAGTKRTRNFTPASQKVIDEEDEPRRASPHVRIGGFGGELGDEA
ncbi:hypothetical protein B0H67DRAFT_641462 [Lasiosphaeris hirsuta]|uniref:Uncharacterized protein n=1 Tax=Lasiosphaeris hirsuta TaxID=260670 RepID=A0AA40AZP3_9PEZI|nr:hypothetical protein B0H67DRAFT_641462 [Lasiosphaeris hirsuta]